MGGLAAPSFDEEAAPSWWRAPLYAVAGADADDEEPLVFPASPSPPAGLADSDSVVIDGPPEDGATPDDASSRPLVTPAGAADPSPAPPADPAAADLADADAADAASDVQPLPAVQPLPPVQPLPTPSPPLHKSPDPDAAAEKIGVSL